MVEEDLPQLHPSEMAMGSRGNLLFIGLATKVSVLILFILGGVFDTHGSSVSLSRGHEYKFGL